MGHPTLDNKTPFAFDMMGLADEVWNKTRKPLLPKNFDRRYFNAAAPGLVAPGYLKGDEPVA